MPEDTSASSNRWKDLLASLSGALGGIAGVLAAWEDLRNKLQGLRNLDPLFLGIAGGLLLAVAIYLQRDRLQRRPILLHPDALRLHAGEHFVGRQAETEVLLESCAGWPLVWLIGESGVGKSSLVRYGLLPRLRDDPKRFPVYISSWGLDWVQGPLDALAEALAGIGGEGSKAVGDAAALETLLRSLSERGILPVLLFDQFDDYYARHSDRLRDGQVLVRPDRLAALNPFWDLVGKLTEEGAVRCLFVARRETAWSLEGVRFHEPKVQYLDRLPSGHALELLETLSGAGAVLHPQNGFETLKHLLARDLEESGRSLPIQIKVAFQGLRHLRYLTPGEYRRRGGLLGLEIGYIRSHLDAAAQFSGLDVPALRTLLRAMVSPVAQNTEPRTEPELLALLPESSREPERLRRALSHLEEKEVVRRTLTRELAGSSWQLDHDYLSQGVSALIEREAR